MARDFLAIPRTSVPIEREFSVWFESSLKPTQTEPIATLTPEQQHADKGESDQILTMLVTCKTENNNHNNKFVIQSNHCRQF
uniref:Uncharacterized protein n=1 Tax=Strigamia maritima TaxID=126957 RepID=T1J623_STRMM